MGQDSKWRPAGSLLFSPRGERKKQLATSSFSWTRERWVDIICGVYQVRLLAEPVKSARKMRQEARLKAQAEKMEKKLRLTPLTPGKVKMETPNKGNKSHSLLFNL